MAVVAWILAVLSSFRLLRPVLRTLHGVLTYEIRIGKVSLTLGGMLLFGAAVYVAFWIARWLRVILSDEVLPRMALPRGVANSVSTLSYYAVVLGGLMFALAASGVEMSQFAIVFGALGVGIGFGLQNIVNNFVSGLILMFERPIQPGDTVEITGTTGTVREIGMRATTLKTGEGADVVIPNGTLLSEKLINWTMSDMNRRVDVDLGVAYGTDPRKVATLLTEVTASCTGIGAQPAPAVIFKGFGANSLDFGIRAWTRSFGDWVAIRSELSMRVNEALVAAGIEIPFPQQDIHIRSFAAEARASLVTNDAHLPSPRCAEPDPPRERYACVEVSHPRRARSAPSRARRSMNGRPRPSAPAARRYLGTRARQRTPCGREPCHVSQCSRCWQPSRARSRRSRSSMPTRRAPVSIRATDLCASRTASGRSRPPEPS